MAFETWEQARRLRLRLEEEAARSKGIMSRAELNKLLRVTHTDTARHASDKELDDAHRILVECKDVLAKREKPMPDIGLPKTREEFMARRKKKPA